jgi:lysyl oxidase
MADLIPVLSPLKGELGGNKISLTDCEYDYNDNEEPILRFSIAIANIGKGPMYIILGDPKLDPKGRAPAKQRILNDNNGYKEVDVGFFERHEKPDHVHWHYDDLASMEIVNKDGQVVATSDKEGYCLTDSFRYDDNLPNSPAQPYFDILACIQKTEVGVSVGWADHYSFGADDQYIKIKNVQSGRYWLRLTVNKTMLICDTTEPQSVEINIDHENKKAYVISTNST